MILKKKSTLELDTIEVVILTEKLEKNEFEETGQKKMQLVVRQDALGKAWEHAENDMSRETGGLMLGLFIEDKTSFTIVFTGIVPALRAIQKTASLNFTEEAWASMWNIIDGDKEYSDDSIWKIVGWYHTHPGFSVFLSGRDRFIHRKYFTQKGHLALVIDPKNKEQGFFSVDKTTNSIFLMRDLEILSDKGILEKLQNNGFPKIKNLPLSQIPKKW
jgi:proteasome lid subunit RPN8/RPN11